MLRYLRLVAAAVCASCLLSAEASAQAQPIIQGGYVFLQRATPFITNFGRNIHYSGGRGVVGAYYRGGQRMMGRFRGGGGYYPNANLMARSTPYMVRGGNRFMQRGYNRR
jgi:opacity protein-like surface antigen